jgi:hypothetical protein
MRKVVDWRAQGLEWAQIGAMLSIPADVLAAVCRSDPIYLAALSNASTVLSASEHYTALAEVITSLERLSSTTSNRRSKRMAGMHERT